MKYDKRIHPPWLNITYIALTVILVIAIYVVFSIGYASMQYNLAKNYLERWTDTRTVSNQDNYQRAKTAINKALNRHPDNPVYQESLASILVWGDYAGFESTEAVEQALSTYKGVIRSRPLWPWAWSEWVMTKWRLEQYDEEMLRGLLRLEEVGPYIGAANLTVVDAGLELMEQRPDFEAQLKPLVEAHYKRSFTNGQIRNQMLELLDEHDNTAWLREIEEARKS